MNIYEINNKKINEEIKFIYECINKLKFKIDVIFTSILKDYDRCKLFDFNTLSAAVQELYDTCKSLEEHLYEEKAVIIDDIYDKFKISRNEFIEGYRTK